MPYDCPRGLQLRKPEKPDLEHRGMLTDSAAPEIELSDEFGNAQESALAEMDACYRTSAIDPKTACVCVHL
jgi:hypothetical protein